MDFRDALTELGRMPQANVSQLLELAAKVTGKVVDAGPEATYLLYSGAMPDETSSGAVVGSIRRANVPSVYDIGDSEIGKLLGDDHERFYKRFQDAVAREFEFADYSQVPEAMRSAVDDKVNVYFTGVNSGVRVDTGSLWDVASHAFVAENDGHFRIVAGKAFDRTSVLVTSEIAAFLQKTGGSLLDGVPVEVLKAHQAEKGLEAALNAIELKSMKLQHFTELSSANFEKWLRLEPAEIHAALADSNRQKSWLARVEAGEILPMGAYQSANEWIADLGKRAESLPGGAKVLKGLKIFGAAAGVAVLFVHAKEANAAYQAGNDAEGNRIIAEAVADLAGSGLLQFAAGAIAAVGAAALVAAGAISTPVAGALVLTAAVAGGYFGGDAGVQFYRLLSDNDKSGNIDLVDKLLNVLRGATTLSGSPLVADLDGNRFTIDAALTAAELRTRAFDSIAWRFALRELNSFVVTDVGYERFNTDGSLDLVDPVTGEGSMSREYLADRAAMLAWKLKYERNGAQDADDLPREGPKPYNEDWDTSLVAGNWDYVDLTQRLPGGAPLELSIDGTGLSLHDHQVVFGTVNADTISGEGDSDRLYGAAGNDTLDGKDGDDYLEGGAGADSYNFSGTFGKDVVFDSDGLGTIRIGTDAIGEAKASGRRNTWSVKLANGKVAELELQDDASSGTGRVLVITTDGSAGSSVTIRNFNLAKAQSDGGYLGIKLEAANKIALLGQPANFWEDPAADITTLAGRSRTIEENGGTSFSVSLNQGAKAGETVTISLVGLSDKGVRILVDGQTHSTDSVTVTLFEGQTQLTFALLHDGDLSADAAGSLKAVFNGQAGTAESNTWSLTLQDAGETPEPFAADFMARTTLSTGVIFRYDPDGRAITVVAEGDMKFVTDANGNLVSGGDVLVTNNTIYGTETGDDRIDGGVGNDLVAGAGGNDYLEGGAGDDMISGGSGNDTILGGEGDDFISSGAAVYEGTQQYGAQDVWTLWGAATGATVLASGGGWGVFRMDDGELHWSGMGLTPMTDQMDMVDGGGGNDFIIGSWGADWLQGGDGNDQVTGLGGNDVIEGNAGDDELLGDGTAGVDGLRDMDPASHGEDSIDGGDGNDRIHGGGRADEIFGGAGNDSIWGDSDVASSSEQFLPLNFHGDDYIDGEAGDDFIEANGGNDTLFGGDGADILLGDTGVSKLGAYADDPLAWGSDYLDGEAGEDKLAGGGGDDTLFGGDDDDQLDGDESSADLAGAVQGRDYLDGEGGNDRLIGGGNDDILFGGVGNDTLQGDAVTDLLAGEYHGSDELDGEEGDDTLFGQGGADQLYGSSGNDTLLGDAAEAELAASYHGDDYLDGGAGADTLIGGGGNDVLLGGDDDDILLGDDSDARLQPSAHGDDYLDGGAGADKLFGLGGDDELQGGEGDDYLAGGEGDDMLDGGEGANTLEGGAGNDTLMTAAGGYLRGGAGDDTHVVSVTPGNSVLAVIDDTEGDNQLVLDTPDGSGSYRVFVQNGTAFVAANGQAVVALAQGTNLAGLSVWNSGDGTSLRNIVVAGDPGGRIRSMAQEGGALISTAQITSSQELTGSGYADALDGGASDDILHGGDGDDALLGGAGDDTLAAGDGADLIVGGTGDDLLLDGDIDGSADDSADIYHFAIGDGADRIEAVAAGGGTVPRDVISFGEGIAANSIQFVPGQTSVATGHADLLVSYGQGDSITLSPGAFSQIAEIRFSNGDVLTREQILQRASASDPGGPGTIRDEWGTLANGVLIGGGQADFLRGGQGDDTLVGGTGNDVLAGAAGRNTYVFGADSGSDSIVQADWELNEFGHLQFTDASMGELTAFFDRNDVVVMQASGALVRIRDVGELDWLVENWQVTDRNGTQAALWDLLDFQGPPEPVSLEERRAEFGARQLVQLATLPQRLALDDVSSVTGPVVPTSVQQVTQQVDASGYLAHDHYLDANDVVQTTTVYESHPVYRTQTFTTPARPGMFMKLEDMATGPLPPGAVPVFGSAPSGGAGHGEVGAGVLIGYTIPPTPAGSYEVTRQVGWESVAVTYSITTSNDVATQSLVTGTAGEDVIQAAAAAGTMPVLFRGVIATGAGNDRVLLTSGSNSDSMGRANWTRFDEWTATLSISQESGHGSFYDRGLGAWLDLGEGDDFAVGTDGDDFFIGGAGSDYMDGQAGSDTYYVSYTPGSVDRISDLAYRDSTSGWSTDVPLEFAPDNRDTIELASGITEESLSYRWVRSRIERGDDMVRTVRTLQLFTDGNHFLDIDYVDGDQDYNGRSGIEVVHFEGGARTSLSWLLEILPVEPSAVPELSASIPQLTVFTGALNSVNVGSWFAEPDGDLLTFSAELADGSPLPGFLEIDTETGTISSLAGAVNVGVYSIRITATDSDGQSADGTFDLAVARNDAPVLHAPPSGPLLAETGAAVQQWQVPLDMFADPDGDALSYSVAGVDGEPLAAWLHFDPATGLLSGVSPADVGTIFPVVVRVTDVRGAATEAVVELRTADAVMVGSEDADEHGGTEGSDLWFGLGGSDMFFGWTGNDIIHGGEGDDFLYGEEGSDVYVFDGAFGHDTLAEYVPGELNHVFLSDWSSTTVVVWHGYEDNLMLRSPTSGDSIEFFSWFAGGDSYLLHFSDGVVWDAMEVNARLGPQIVTEFADVFQADGDTVVDTLAGDDQIYVGAGTHVLRGGDGNDIIDAYAPALFEGEAGDDQLYGGGGPQFFAGGTGADFISAYDDDLQSGRWYVVAMNAGDGQDTVQISHYRDNSSGVLSLGGGVELGDVRLTADFESGNLTVHYGDGDSVTFAGWFWFDSEVGETFSRSLVLQLIDGPSVRAFDLGAVARQFLVEAAQGSDGTSWAAHDALVAQEMDLAGMVHGGLLATEYAANGTTRGLSAAQIRQELAKPALGYNPIVEGTDGSDWLHGGIAADELRGYDGSDDLYGYEGADTLDGGAGSDFLEGGAGSDTYLFGQGFGQDYIFDPYGEQNDVVLLGWSSSDFALSQVYGSLILRSKVSSDRIEFYDWFDGGNAFLIHFDGGIVWDSEEVAARLGPQVISPYDDVFEGGGDVTIDALAGDDAIWLEGGVHIVRGGLGNDHMSSWGGRGVTEGEDGADYVEATSAPHFLAGGTGSDSYSLGMWLDAEPGPVRHVIAFNRGDGHDTVSPWYDSGEYGILSLGGGASLADISLTLDANTGSVTVHLGPDDSITYQGWFYPESPDFLPERRLLLQLLNGDAVAAFDLAAVIQQFVAETLASGLGAPWAARDALLEHQSLQGTGGAFGGLLAATYAQAGSTRGLSREQIVEVLADPLFLREAQAFQTANLIEGTSGADSLVGTAGADRIDAGAGADSLNGGAGNDTLLGGDGNDWIFGGAGADAMTGGQGNDVYYADDAGDTVTEAQGEGTDTVYTSVSFAAANVENINAWNTTTGLSLGGNDLANSITGGAGDDMLDGGAAADSLNGGAGNDTLVGGEGNDWIFGGAGADAMTGGQGNDVYYADDAGDSVTEAQGEGTDTVYTSVSFASANVENINAWNTTAGLSLGGNELANSITGGAGDDVLDGGAAADSLNGGAGNDTLLGGEGNDWIFGGAGADAMTGGQGNDVYYADDAGDSVTEAQGEGTDTVYTSVSFAAANVENINAWNTTTGLSLSGNELANSITGGAGDDVLDGGAGTDTLNGGAGSDTYRSARGSGSDRVIDVDATAGNADVLAFAADVASDQLWLRRVGSDLEVAILGSGDRLTVAGWYVDQAHHVESIRAGDGKVLSDVNVQNLVQAMAAFAPPAAGETHLSPELASQLAPTLAANWQ